MESLKTVASLPRNGHPSKFTPRSDCLMLTDRGETFIYLFFYFFKRPHYIKWPMRARWRCLVIVQQCHAWWNPNSEHQLKQTIKHGGGAVMIWVCFAAAGPETTLNSTLHLDILQTHNMRLSVQELELGWNRNWVVLEESDEKFTNLHNVVKKKGEGGGSMSRFLKMMRETDKLLQNTKSTG